MRCGGRGELPGSPGTRSRLNMFVKDPRYRERFFLYTAKKLLPRVSSAKAAVWVLTSVSLDYGLPRRCYMRARPSEYPTMYPRRAICVKLLLLYQGRLYIVLYICADCFDSARTRAAGSMDQATCHRGREAHPAAAPHPNCPNFDFKPCPPSLPSVLELQVIAGLMNGNLRASFATRMSAINVQCRREACMTSPPRPRHYCNAASSKFRSPA